VAARGASAAFGGFGFALKTAATFDVFYWLQVTNYGVLYVLFDSAPSGSNYIDVWDLCLHAQTASTIISSQPFSDESGESKPKSCLIACVKAARITNRPLPSIRSHPREADGRTDSVHCFSADCSRTPSIHTTADGNSKTLYFRLSEL
jgi:hypothetical protein